MTKKHFKLIADIIANFEPPFSECNSTSEEDIVQTEETRYTLALTFARVLKFENPNFDKERFMAACGVNSNYAGYFG